MANILLLLTANVLGLTAYFVEEKQQRRAFLETRQSLEVKLVIEEQSAEQVRNKQISLFISFSFYHKQKWNKINELQQMHKKT